MKFLIVGASGFIGRHVLKLAKRMGHNTLGTRSRSGSGGLVKFDLLEDRIATQVGADFWKSDGQVIAVICAAISQIDRCFLERDASYKANVENTVGLIEDLRLHDSKPVFLSSSFVFDGSIGYYPDVFPHSPISEYGRHKSEVEMYLTQNVPEALVLRLDKIIGSDPEEHHLFADWHRSIVEQETLVCIEGQLFSPTFVDDVARAVIFGVERNMAGVFNVANSEFSFRDELARQFALILGKRVEVVCKSQKDLGFADLRPLKSYLDATKFASATGMRFTSIREVMREFARRIQSEENGQRDGGEPGQSVDSG